MTIISPDQIEKIAEEVALRTVNKMFLALGANTGDPSEITKLQKDLAHLRSWRESTDAIKKRGLLTVVTVVVTAGMGWILTFIFKWHT